MKVILGNAHVASWSAIQRRLASQPDRLTVFDVRPLLQIKALYRTPST